MKKIYKSDLQPWVRDYPVLSRIIMFFWFPIMALIVLVYNGVINFDDSKEEIGMFISAIFSKWEN